MLRKMHHSTPSRWRPTRSWSFQPVIERCRCEGGLPGEAGIHHSREDECNAVVSGFAASTASWLRLMPQVGSAPWAGGRRDRRGWYSFEKRSRFALSRPCSTRCSRGGAGRTRPGGSRRRSAGARNERRVAFKSSAAPGRGRGRPSNSTPGWPRTAGHTRLCAPIRTAQVRLGHSDSRLTLELYAQAVGVADRAAAEVLGRCGAAIGELPRAKRARATRAKPGRPAGQGRDQGKRGRAARI